MDRLTSLRVFADLPRSGSIAGTARSLGMSQTMATKHLNALEGHLGTKLLHRATRALTLTAAGHLYLEAVSRWLTEIDSLETDLRDATETPRGHVRMTAPVALGISRLTGIIADFLIKYPKMTVELDLSDRFSNLVGDGFDLAIRVTNKLTGPDLIARKLSDSVGIFCAAPSYIARAGKPQSRADLVGHNCLGYLGMDRLHRFRWRAQEAGIVEKEPSGSFFCANSESTLKAALAGLGIVYEPEFIVRPHLASGALVQLAIDDGQGMNSGVYLVMPSRQLVPARIRLIADFIARAWSQTATSAIAPEGNTAVTGA